jgi:hypothetical protein
MSSALTAGVGVARRDCTLTKALRLSARGRRDSCVPVIWYSALAVECAHNRDKTTVMYTFFRVEPHAKKKKKNVGIL